MTWLVATAEAIDADVVGADRAAVERLGTTVSSPSIERLGGVTRAERGELRPIGSV